MQFSILHLALATALVAAAFALALLPVYGQPISAIFVVAIITAIAAYWSPTETIPKYLSLRWHLAPLLAVFIISFPGLMYFSIGFWFPPISWAVSIVWIVAVMSLEVAKMHFPDEPHTKIRLIQIVGCWTIAILNTFTLIVGQYSGP